MKLTSGEIADLLSSAPPRKVSDRVARAAKGGSAFGFPAFFCVVFGGMGLLFTWLFFPTRVLDDWRLNSGSARTTPGQIIEVKRTSMSVNKTRVIAYSFQYTPENGGPLQGRCYTTGTVWAPNNAVTVRYLPADPAVACVEGARLSEAGWAGIFVVIFPLVGVGLVVGFVISRRRTQQLLEQGQVAEVDVLSVNTTAVRVNKQTVYKIVISSATFQGGGAVTVRRWDAAEVDLALKHLQNKQPMFVLYDPLNPKRMLFPESLIKA